MNSNKCNIQLLDEYNPSFMYTHAYICAVNMWLLLRRGCGHETKYCPNNCQGYDMKVSPIHPSSIYIHMHLNKKKKRTNKKETTTFSSSPYPSLFPFFSLSIKTTITTRKISLLIWLLT
ncbi:hypothetical protein, unlikely [Trypanosoma brucei gambiense DAL972]|uniref:Uncharacterized protein n=1 Tax=Trypanosoma brucei gambiense (strain MHOM/CI/86/DAL972) TaxID=679716 RepID=C9ZJ07_TRYB9|nr:hypothetical protein, unlikely [Trypanosoma brucei gambiense DAL972]CBH09365.1 hypothetical protein, unlikely [Trypanosoma brucei gambiense DAL972]|eukprot:XP_011771671.1 hypothetical protein, unlikely [Trypanosoma brucei gambiense DAL972]